MGRDCVMVEHWPPPPPPLFIRLASNAFPEIGSVGHIEKKNYQIKSQEVSK